MKTMDIYSTRGTKIRFQYPDHGSPYDQVNARENLALGKIYTVDTTRVGSWHTDVFLQEVEGRCFNSVMFAPVTEEELLIKQSGSN